MNTISYTITRENLNCGNFNVCESAEKESASSFCSLLMSVISNILDSKEETDDEKDR